MESRFGDLGSVASMLWSAWLRAAKGIVPAWLYLPAYNKIPAEIITISSRPGSWITPTHLKDPDRLAEAFESYLMSRTGNGFVDVRIDPDDVYSKEVRLPRNAIGKAEQILALDHLRSVPSKNEAVFWTVAGWRIEKKTAVGRQYFIKQSIVDNIKAALLPSNRRIRTVSLDLDEQHIPLVDNRKRADRAIRFWFLATAAIILLICISVFNFFRTDMRDISNYNEQLSERTVTLFDQLDALTNRNRVYDTALDARQLIKAELSIQSDRVYLLSEVTKVLSDGVWLSELSLVDNVVLISGFSSEPSASLVRLIEEQEWAENVGLSAPVTRDQVTGKERFQLRFYLPRVIDER